MSTSPTQEDLIQAGKDRDLFHRLLEAFQGMREYRGYPNFKNDHNLL